MLQENYKGKTFAAISKEIHKKYKDRHDTISKNGFNDEMGRLREANETARIEKLKKQQNLLTSQMKMMDGGFIGNTSGIGQTNPLRLAPVLANAIGAITTGKGDVETAEQITASPAQQVFQNVDISNIERNIAEQGRSFTRNNVSASGGNQGMFLSNELGSQLNQLRALGDVGIKQQTLDRETDQLRAQEQGRVDAFNANVQGQNANFRQVTKDINARNQSAADTIRSQKFNNLATDIGNIGKEEQQGRMVIGASGGYNQFGEFVGMDAMQTRTGSPLLDDVTSALGNLFKKKK